MTHIAYNPNTNSAFPAATAINCCPSRTKRDRSGHCIPTKWKAPNFTTRVGIQSKENSARRPQHQPTLRREQTTVFTLRRRWKVLPLSQSGCGIERANYTKSEPLVDFSRYRNRARPACAPLCWEETLYRLSCFRTRGRISTSGSGRRPDFASWCHHQRLA